MALLDMLVRGTNFTQGLHITYWIFLFCESIINLHNKDITTFVEYPQRICLSLVKVLTLL